MKLNIKLVLIFILILNILPTHANINGGISKSSFYDTKKTIMTDLPDDKTILTEKYWSKNLHYPGKYKPLFILSDKDLFNLNPVKKNRVIPRGNIPTVYNVSLKSQSVITVALKSENALQKNINKTTNDLNTTDLVSLYEVSKNPEIEIQTKLDTVISLKNSNKFVNYKLAMDLLNDITQIEPSNAYAYYLKGELYSLQNSPESAMKNYVKALQINPLSKECFIGIAKILEPTNKQLAEKYYNMAKN